MHSKPAVNVALAKLGHESMFKVAPPPPLQHAGGISASPSQPDQQIKLMALVSAERLEFLKAEAMSTKPDGAHFLSTNDVLVARLVQVGQPIMSSAGTPGSGR